MKEKIATLMSAAPSVEKEEEEEKKRQAELRRAQDQLKKCLEDVDYTGAAAVKEKIAALMSAAPSVEKEEEEKKRQAELRRAQDCPAVLAAQARALEGRLVCGDGDKRSRIEASRWPYGNIGHRPYAR